MTSKNIPLNEQRKHSSRIVDGNDRAASRAMLRPLGFKDKDFRKPHIGVASTGSQVTPCNMHINGLAEHAINGVDSSGGKAILFNTITISDGISMGTENMKYSLVSREVIADSIETVIACQGYDGLIAIGGCDKNMPGCMIAIERLNRPAIFVYGGTILPGEHDGKQLDVVSVFEAIGAQANDKIPLRELKAIEERAIPGPGSCGGMYTANTMASAIEAMGMSLPMTSTMAAPDDEKADTTEAAGQRLVGLVEEQLLPRDIMTREVMTIDSGERQREHMKRMEAMQRASGGNKKRKKKR